MPIKTDQIGKTQDKEHTQIKAIIQYSEFMLHYWIPNLLKTMVWPLIFHLFHWPQRILHQVMWSVISFTAENRGKEHLVSNVQKRLIDVRSIIPSKSIFQKLLGICTKQPSLTANKLEAKPYIYTGAIITVYSRLSYTQVRLCVCPLLHAWTVWMSLLIVKLIKI